jgi:hypothetical protein
VGTIGGTARRTTRLAQRLAASGVILCQLSSFVQDFARNRREVSVSVMMCGALWSLGCAFQGVLPRTARDKCDLTRSAHCVARDRQTEYIRRDTGLVAEWQTRWTQNPVSSRTCGFKSHPSHSQLSQALASNHLTSPSAHQCRFTSAKRPHDKPASSCCCRSGPLACDGHSLVKSSARNAGETAGSRCRPRYRHC